MEMLEADIILLLQNLAIINGMNLTTVELLKLIKTL